MKRPHRFLVPEAVQTSAMDCGPAALKAILEGFGIQVSYGRLREACQTDVDGTSIDTIEDLAVQLGLEAQQIMLPRDHILIPEAGALPAIVVARLPNGASHFVVAWSCHGGLVQLMDPATGRGWSSARRFLDELYIHRLPVPAADWREWAGSDEFLNPLTRRMARLGLAPKSSTALIDEARGDSGWRSLASVDAATRMAESLAACGGLRRGEQSTAVLTTLFKQALEGGPSDQAIPPSYWTVLPLESTSQDTEHVVLQGAVLVALRGRTTKEKVLEETDQPTAEAAPLSPELAAALEEPPARPGRELLQLLREDGLINLGTLAGSLFLGAAAVVVQALLLRGLLDLATELGLVGQRLTAMGAITLFFVGVLLLELFTERGLLRLGRQLECRLRLRFLEKIPRLGDKYFGSRLSSDMAERSHSLHRLRFLGPISGSLLRDVFELVLTTVGIIWLVPQSAPLVVLAAVASLGIPLAAEPLLAERDLRFRTHGGALTRFYLDSLLGLTPIRSHGAERSLRREHESLLSEWSRAGLRFHGGVVAVQGLQLIAGFGFAAVILLAYLGRGSEGGSVLLLAFWVLNLPHLGEQIALQARQYPEHRNLTLRLLEPLGAREEAVDGAEAVAPEGPGVDRGKEQAEGVAITMQGVSVVAGGHTILEGINLELEPGSDVAIVGPSGAGKSSLVGLLLGWHRPANGQMRIDRRTLDAQLLASLRPITAWIDPAIQLWNRSLAENLRYGNPRENGMPLSRIIDQANLRPVLQTLPDGLQTPLGEGGALVSGGEGQQVRIGRALLKPGVRLVILDEPFRGLDRSQRRELLERCRARWRQATLLCVSHDIADTVSFDRVLVVEGGRLVEQGAPAQLAQQQGSRYRALLEADTANREGLWGRSEWRRLWLENGTVVEDEGRA